LEEERAKNFLFPSFAFKVTEKKKKEKRKKEKKKRKKRRQDLFFLSLSPSLSFL
jgi:anaerobic ribonucleoside-triphosphate reductase